MSETIVIRGGRILDPASGRDEISDIRIEKGRIEAIGSSLSVSREGIVIDATDQIVAPGFVDLHTHLRQPGREDEETIGSGSKVAAKGGFTTICCMPNTTPTLDEPSMIRSAVAYAREEGVIEVLPIGAVTVGRQGKQLAQLQRMCCEGAVGFSDDGSWVQDSLLMRRALEYSRLLNVPVISHCEDPSLSIGGVAHEGYWSTVLGLRGIPAEAESIAVTRDILLARFTGGHLHIAHVSTGQSIDAIRWARAQGIHVTAEVTPHHFSLSDEAVADYDTNMKVNPPLRSKQDVTAVKGALRDGIVDAIATDHAPHALQEKELEFDEAPFGMVGLETALSLTLRELVFPGILSLDDAIAALTVKPAGILGLDRGRLVEGGPANLTIVDLNRHWRVTESSLWSYCKNSPFLGEELPGVVVWTIHNGNVVFSEPQHLLEKL